MKTFLTCILFVVTTTFAHGIELLWAGVDSYTAGTAVGDGGTDLMELTSSNPTGLSDNITDLKISFWIKPDSGDGTAREVIYFSNANSRRVSVTLTTGNDIQVIGRDSTPTTVLQINSTTTDIVVGGSTDGWYHVLIAIGLTSTSTRHIYIDGVDQSLTINTYNTSGVMDIVGTNYEYTFFATSAGASDFLGALSEVLVDDSYDDVVANYVAGGRPKDLGSLGTSAVFFFHGSGNDFNINSGTGGNPTITGSFTTTTPP